MFTGWLSDATAFLPEIEADNNREFWEANGHRHATATPPPCWGRCAPLAAELEPEFGPIRVLRAHRNRRFRPTSPPYRADTGGVGSSPGDQPAGRVRSWTGRPPTVVEPKLSRTQVAISESPPGPPPPPMK